MPVDYEVFDGKIVDLIQTLIDETDGEDEFWLALCAVTSKLLNESFNLVEQIRKDLKEKEKLK